MPATCTAGVGNGQLSALMSNALTKINGTSTPYDWGRLNSVGNHGSDIFTTTLPKPGAILDTDVQRLDADGVRLTHFLEPIPSDARPWLRLIDGASFRADSFTARTAVLRINAQKPAQGEAGEDASIQ